MSDVEMLSPPQLSVPSSSKPSSSPSPHHTPIIIDDDDDNVRSAPLNETLNVAANAPLTATAVVANPSKKSKPSSASASASITGAKPKSAKPRSPSPSPPPPPPREPAQTIRLEITLGGPDNYEVNIAALSKATGQRPSTPVPVSKRDTSDDSEGDDEGEAQPALKVKKHKKKNMATEYYDVHDPFIDDSELAVEQRTFFAQTKQQGFYVSSGQVALLTDKAPKKPKSKKVSILAPPASVAAALTAAHTLLPGSSASNGGGAAKTEEWGRDESMGLYSEGDSEGRGKRKVSTQGSLDGAGHPKRRRRAVEIHPFHPDLEEGIVQLKEAIKRENWDIKGKFPPALKPPLAELALKAVVLGEYDDNFFNLMPTIFPYNRFTMQKLIKRSIWREHTNLLVERQEVLLRELAALADEGFPKARDDWEKSLVAWEKRQERAKADTDGGGSVSHTHSAEGTPPVSDMRRTPSLLGPATSVDDTGIDSSAEHDDPNTSMASLNGKARDAAKDAHPPPKKYRLTDTMKAIIWQLVCLSNECCRIENEKNTLEGSNQVVSDQGVRKSLYQKIVSCFPDGWLSSGQISRDVSVMKKRFEKEAMENDG